MEKEHFDKLLEEARAEMQLDSLNEEIENQLEKKEGTMEIKDTKIETEIQDLEMDPNGKTETKTEVENPGVSEVVSDAKADIEKEADDVTPVIVEAECPVTQTETVEEIKEEPSKAVIDDMTSDETKTDVEPVSDTNEVVQDSLADVKEEADDVTPVVVEEEEIELSDEEIRSIVESIEELAPEAFEEGAGFDDEEIAFFVECVEALEEGTQLAGRKVRKGKRKIGAAVDKVKELVGTYATNFAVNNSGAGDAASTAVAAIKATADTIKGEAAEKKQKEERRDIALAPVEKDHQDRIEQATGDLDDQRTRLKFEQKANKQEKKIVGDTAETRQKIADTNRKLLQNKAERKIVRKQEERKTEQKLRDANENFEANEEKRQAKSIIENEPEKEEPKTPDTPKDTGVEKPEVPVKSEPTKEEEKKEEPTVKTEETIDTNLSDDVLEIEPAAVDAAEELDAEVTDTTVAPTETTEKIDAEMDEVKSEIETPAIDVELAEAFKAIHEALNGTAAMESNDATPELGNTEEEEKEMKDETLVDKDEVAAITSIEKSDDVPSGEIAETDLEAPVTEGVDYWREEPEEKEFNVDATIESPDGAEIGTEENEKEIEKEVEDQDLEKKDAEGEKEDKDAIGDVQISEEVKEEEKEEESESEEEVEEESEEKEEITEEAEKEESEKDDEDKEDSEEDKEEEESKEEEKSEDEDKEDDKEESKEDEKESDKDEEKESEDDEDKEEEKEEKKEELKEEVQYSSLREAFLLEADYFETPSISTVTAEDKERKLICQLAMLIAKETGDPIFDELTTTCVRMKDLKAAIMTKYEGVAREKAEEVKRSLR